MKIQLDGWKQHLIFSATHFLPKHEKCGLLHGHTYVVSCILEGKPTSDSHMVIDFSTIKTIIRHTLSKLDHHILIPKNHPMVKIESKSVSVQVDTKTYMFPIEDCVLLPIPETTVELLASYLLDQIIKQLPTNSSIHQVTVQVDEGLGQGAIVDRIL